VWPNNKLRVEQDEPTASQTLDQMYQRNLAGITHAVEHAFASKETTDGDAV
jgi:hypothetical protein